MLALQSGGFSFIPLSSHAEIGQPGFNSTAI